MATHSSILAKKIPWTEEPGEVLESIQANEYSLGKKCHQTAKIKYAKDDKALLNNECQTTQRLLKAWQGSQGLMK